jgi:hypothetical protein
MVHRQTAVTPYSSPGIFDMEESIQVRVNRGNPAYTRPEWTGKHQVLPPRPGQPRHEYQYYPLIPTNETCPVWRSRRDMWVRYSVTPPICLFAHPQCYSAVPRNPRAAKNGASSAFAGCKRCDEWVQPQASTAENDSLYESEQPTSRHWALTSSCGGWRFKNCFL